MTRGDWTISLESPVIAEIDPKILLAGVKPGDCCLACVYDRAGRTLIQSAKERLEPRLTAATLSRKR
jgi:hypothetical protein